MTVLESEPDKSRILDFLDESVRVLQDAALEPRFILMGSSAYTIFREAVSERFGRSPGYFEQYQYLTIVVDPFRKNTVCVIPAPRDVAEGVRGESV
ncbi:MAG: family 4C encapsulin nanocompartment shell protein [Rubricoccaceae bacterium]|nr:family 4C encapsulin nanocompartment shell protein [Rubricoccaceae bacterium]